MQVQNPAIEPYWDWAMKHVSSFANIHQRNQYMIEDLAQEAWIAMWIELDKANKKGKSVNDSFLKQKGRWKVLDAVTVRQHSEVAYSPAEVPVRPSEAVEGEMALHWPEIWAAVAELTPRQREYVYLRFWHGLNGPELRSRGFGNSLWYGSQKTPGIRAILTAKLRHLADAV